MKAVSMSLPSADLAVLGEETPPVDEADRQAIVGRSPIRIAFDRLRSDKVAVVCAFIVVSMVVLAVLAPVITGLLDIHETTEDGELGPTALDYVGFPKPEYGPPNGGFNASHILGIAPRTAYDNLAVLLYGMRLSLFIALICTAISVAIGLTIGLVAGFSRGWLDRVLSFVIDLFLSFPLILFAIALNPIITSRFATNDAVRGRVEIVSLIIVLSTLGWMGLARLIRGQVLSLREREFVLAAQVMGMPTRRILFKEMLPNLLASIVIVVSFMIPAFIASEVALSALGIGLKGANSLGAIIQSSQGYWRNYPLYLWAPVLVVTVLVIALNMLGDSVRDAFDPKTRR